MANFVQTEQILVVGEQQLSYVLLRGSVPIFWYQPLTNYRPKPVLLKTSGTNKKHLKKLFFFKKTSGTTIFAPSGEIK